MRQRRGLSRTRRSHLFLPSRSFRIERANSLYADREAEALAACSSSAVNLSSASVSLSSASVNLSSAAVNDSSAGVVGDPFSVVSLLSNVGEAESVALKSVWLVIVIKN
jgi:hypothetical protein